MMWQTMADAATPRPSLVFPRTTCCPTAPQGGLYLPNLVEAVTYCQAAGSAALCSALAYRQRDGMTLLCRGHHDTAGGGTAAYDVSSWVTVLRKVLPPADRDL